MNSVSRIFHSLDQHQVAWVLLRAPRDLSVLSSGDYDLLIDLSHAREADEAFRSEGFVRLPRSGAHYLRYDASSDRWLWFHVVHELSFGRSQRMTAGTASTYLARRTGDAPPRLADDDAFWELLLHCALDKHRVPTHHQHTLERLATRKPTGGPLAEFVGRRCAATPGAPGPAAIVDMTVRRDWDGVSRSLRLLENHRPDHRERWRRRVRRLTAPVRRVRTGGGLTVALLGPDGAGKSTLANGIARSSPLPVRVMYMGLTGGGLKRVARFRVPGIVFAGRALVIWQRYLRSLLHRAQGRIVVFDRYTFDAAVPHPRRLNRAERLSRWLDGYLCPAPDLVLILDAPGEVMHRRKGEYTAEMLEDWRRHFRALTRRLTRVEVIDATQPPEAVRVDAMERIWRHYYARWGSR
jgi:thymidylate kinase